VSRTRLTVLLRRHGFSPVKAELWSEFVQHVVQTFTKAADELTRTSNWDRFKEKRGALGKPRKRGGASRRIPIEDAITSELAIVIKQIRRSLPASHFLRMNEVAFHVEDPVPSDERAGRHSRKVDFCVWSATGPDAPELAVEAKPLVTQADITNRYLADEGLGCFLTADSPYTTGPLGAMLAYTISAVPFSWQVEIVAAINSLAPSPLEVESAVLVSKSRTVPVSRHARPAAGLEPIAILHLEMLFPPD
jgi:hypothetical protein